MAAVRKLMTTVLRLAWPLLALCLAPQDPPAAPVEAPLAGGATREHPIDLAPGELLRVAVEQRGIDVVLVLRGPSGAPLLEVDGVTGALGTEELLWVAAEGGRYVLEVHASEPTAAAGRYALRLERAAAAGERERTWMAAQRTFLEGRKAQQEGSGAGWQRAARAFEAALPQWRAAGDAAWEAATLLNLGAARLRLSDPEAAREAFEQALVLQRRLGDRRGEGATLSNLGNVSYRLSRLEEAQSHYEQALAIRREVHDRSGEAVTLTNLANVYKDEGQSERARECYEQALAIHRELGNRRGEGVTLTNLGIVYGELGQFERARAYFEQALAISREASDRRREAGALNSLGFVHQTLRQYAQARELFERSLAVAREVQDRTGEAWALDNIGDAHAQLGEHEKARELHEQALALHRETRDRNGEAQSLARIGVAWKSLGDPERGRDHLERALTIWREVGARGDEAGALYDLALLARDRGDLATARAHSAAALSLVESVRSDVGANDLRSSFFASVQDAFALAVDVLMQLHRAEPRSGHDAAALEVSERGRARVLLDLLGESGADIREGVPPELLARERGVRQRLNAAAAERHQLLSGPHGPEPVAALDAQIAALTGEQQEVEAQLRRTSPRYAALVQPQPLGVAEIQAQIEDGDTLLLIYSLGAAGEPRSYLWAVTPDGLASFELPGRDAIEAAARRYLELLTRRRRGAEAAARDLGRMLLGPVAERLGRKRLVVIADGALQYVPFAALPAPLAGRAAVPLVVDHEIVHEPSASALAVLRRELAGRSAAAKAVAVLADPVFDPQDARVTGARKAAAAADPPLGAALQRAFEAGTQGAGTRLPRLPFARREAQAIAAAARPGEAMTALDFRASRQVATSGELARYRIVHFATHGLLDAARPELSGLVLSLVDQQGRPQDGFLRLHDIYNLHLQAQLVVLSACQTGLGQEIKGEGLVGLTRGFLYAGAAQVVASLWHVDDAATAELMRRFYADMLRKGARPAAALRAAQVAMLREDAWRSPYYWAGFVAQGEWR
jgi:CHAT domain-containing protein/tetratricopeptide (TPR) repeat protein